MLTKESDYAIRVIAYLRDLDKDSDVVSVKDIADAMLVPYRFARKVTSRLAAVGLIVSVRGKNGGVRVNPEYSEMSVFDVVSAIDPKSMILNKCLIEPESCSRSGTCPIHQRLLEAQPAFENLFRSIKL